MSVEGALSVKMHLSDGAVSDVVVSSTRPLQLPQILTGRRPDEATQMIGLLYRICSVAQSTASVQAIEAAKRVVADSHTQWLRRQLLHVEVMREHLWMILLEWPLLMDQTPDRETMAEIMTLSSRFKQLLDANDQACRSAVVQEKVDMDCYSDLCGQYQRLLADALFAMPPSQWLCLSAEDMLLWAAREKSGAARLLHHLMGRGWAGLGGSDVAGLPDLEVASIESLLAGDDADAFIAKPHLEGRPYETTTYSRCSEQPLIQALRERFSGGLLTRFSAVLVEVALTMEALQSMDQSSVTGECKADGSGIGIVEAARGRLIHCVTLQQDEVKSYQIVAPTEWNFHPQGALVKGLRSLDVSDKSGLQQQADMLIHAMDPCVSYSLEVSGYA